MNFEGETIFLFHILSAVVILITSTVLQLKFEGEKKSIYRKTFWTVFAQTGSLFAYFVVFVPYFFWVVYGAFEKKYFATIYSYSLVLFCDFHQHWIDAFNEITLVRSRNRNYS